MEPELHRSSGQHAQVLDAIRPTHSHQRLVGGQRAGVLLGERRDLLLCVVLCHRDGPPVRVQDLDAQLAIGRVGFQVHEEVVRVELHRSRRQHAALRPGVHRGEAIAAQRRQTHCPAAVALALCARAPAEVEVQVPPDDLKTARDGLHVAPVPVALFLRHINQRSAVRPVPVIAIAAEAEPDGVRFRAALGNVFVAAPDREEADHQALVAHRVEVVELGRDLQIGAQRVEPVGADPHLRLRDFLPVRPGEQVLHLPVATRARLAPAVAQAVAPHLAERIPKHRRAVARRAGAQHARPPVNAVRRVVQREAERVAVLVRAPHLVTLRWVGRFLIEPHRRGVARVELHEVAAGLHIELRLLPINAVGRGRQRGATSVAGHVVAREERLHAGQLARKRVLQQPAVLPLEQRAARWAQGQQLRRALLHTAGPLHVTEPLRRVNQRAVDGAIQLGGQHLLHHAQAGGIHGLERSQRRARRRRELLAEEFRRRVRAGIEQSLHERGGVLNFLGLELRRGERAPRVQPHAVAERHRHSAAQLLPLAVRLHHGVVGMQRRRMPRALERVALDEEVVHEQLAAIRDVNHRRWVAQVRHGHRLARFVSAFGRPDFREDDAVVKRLAHARRGSDGRGG